LILSSSGLDDIVAVWGEVDVRWVKLKVLIAWLKLFFYEALVLNQRVASPWLLFDILCIIYVLLDHIIHLALGEQITSQE
jgi:hypothetical protein